MTTASVDWNQSHYWSASIDHVFIWWYISFVPLTLLLCPAWKQRSESVTTLSSLSSHLALQVWPAAPSSPISPWSVFHPPPCRPATHPSARLTRTSALTWSITCARCTAAPPCPWSQQPEDSALLTVSSPLIAFHWTLLFIVSWKQVSSKIKKHVLCRVLTPDSNYGDFCEKSGTKLQSSSVILTEIHYFVAV